MVKREYRVKVYDAKGNVIGRVRYNAVLDFWDGRSWSCGSIGRHLGITTLKDGRYVLIHGTGWQEEKDSAEVVTAEEALQAILKSGHFELLKAKRFIELRKLHEIMIKEENFIEKE
jgi:hypothetical protein